MYNTSGNKIVLLGLPGSGKSTLGKHVSLSLQYPFYDLDELITDHIGNSISLFFKEKGEEQFRLIESQRLQETLEREESFVLSTGGGAPCFYNNIDIINKHSLSIYIDVPVKVLVKRLLKNGGGQRPMFYNLSEEEVFNKIIALKDSRKKFYDQAKIKLSGENISTELIISALSEFRN